MGGHSGDGRVDFEEFVSLMCRSFKSDQKQQTAKPKRHAKRATLNAAGAGVVGGGTSIMPAGAGGAGAGGRRKSEQKRPFLSFQLPPKITGIKGAMGGGGGGGGGGAGGAAKLATSGALATGKKKLDEAQTHRMELRSAYAVLDWDGDGLISANDLKQAFASIGDHYTLIEIEEMMREVSTGATVAVHPHMTGVVDVNAAIMSAAANGGGPLSPGSAGGAGGGGSGAGAGANSATAVIAAAQAPPQAITFGEFAAALSP